MGNKPNALLEKLEAKYRAESAYKVNVALQMAKDVADMAANEVFKLGESRAPTWTEVYSRIMDEMMRMVAADGKDDPEFAYAKAKIDARLKQINGKHFQPWEVRYDI